MSMSKEHKIELGLKTLYDPQWKGLETSVDIIAVHGISADADRTWTSRNVNWLSAKHMLPLEAPSARILRFSYESEWLGRDAFHQRLSVVADQLLGSISWKRRPNDAQRPIIFIAHCVGGLVVEKAIILSKLLSEDYPNIFPSIAGIILLGTPHRGSRSQTLASLLANISSVVGLGSANSLLNAAGRGCDTLVDTVQQFTRTANLASIPVFCFFEQHYSDVAKCVRPTFMRWLRYRDTVVDESSGCIDGYPKRGLACDHFNLQRFAHADDGNYRHVVNEILRFMEAAPQTVSKWSRSNTLRHLSYNNRRMCSEVPKVAAPHCFEFSVHLEQHEERTQACLQALYITNPADDLQKIVQTKDRLVEGTCSWLFNKPAYHRWLKAESGILWVHGNPGKGKTMLAVAVVEDLMQKTEIGGSEATSGLAYFFCDGEDDRRNSGIAVLRGIIYQILCQHPDLCSIFLTEYERQKEQLFHSPNALQSLWRILSSTLNDTYCREIYLVIDGLDECPSNAVQDILSLLEPWSDSSRLDQHSQRKSIAGCNIKWLITSRNQDLICQSFSAVPDISLENNSVEVSSAVNIFVDAKMKQLTRNKHYSAELASTVRNNILERSEGTFLWVAEVCRELMKPKVLLFDTTSYLSKVPTRLTATYDNILDQLKAIEDAPLFNLTMRILRAMLIAERPLNVAELGIVAGIPEKHQCDKAMLEEYVRACGSFVELRGEMVSFIHSSARDYLLTTAELTSPTLNWRRCGDDEKRKAPLNVVTNKRKLSLITGPDSPLTPTRIGSDPAKEWDLRLG